MLPFFAKCISVNNHFDQQIQDLNQENKNIECKTFPATVTVN